MHSLCLYINSIYPKHKLKKFLKHCPKQFFNPVIYLMLFELYNAKYLNLHSDVQIYHNINDSLLLH